MIKQRDIIVFFSLLFVFGGYREVFGQDHLGKLSCICIDAGHGGRDPGTVSGKVKEKDITLSVALKLGELIQKSYPDIKIVYTRKKDVAVDLRERGRIANRAKAQLFISIHVNQFNGASVNGAETFVLGLHKSQASLQVAMKENAAIHYEEDYSVKYGDFDPRKPESYILFNMMKNAFLSNSLELAISVQRELAERAKMSNREVRQAGFIVLMDVAMPAILVETGFISNAGDLKKLTSTSGQNSIAESIFHGFKAYKEKIERNSIVIKGTGGHADKKEVAQVDKKEVTQVDKKEVTQVDKKEVAQADKKEVESSTSYKLAPEGVKGASFFYAVQIFAAKSLVANLKQFRLDEAIHTLEADGLYRYYVSPCSSYTDVVTAQQRVKKSIQDCFIIAIKDGKRFPVEEARKLEKRK